MHEVFAPARGARPRGDARSCRRSRAAAARDEIDAIRFERIGALPTYYPRAAARCARATRRGEFDVVVECLNKLPFLAPLYSARPVLGLCHHLFGSHRVPPGRRGRSPRPSWRVERAIPLAYRRAPIVAISESTRDDLVARGMPAAQVEVQHPGDPAARHAARADRASASRSSSTSGGSRPTSASTSCSRRSRGSPPRRPASGSRCSGAAPSARASSGAPRRSGSAIAWCSRASSPDAERDAWLARARVCVCASRKEGFGLTVIEANALGHAQRRERRAGAARHRAPRGDGLPGRRRSTRAVRGADRRRCSATTRWPSACRAPRSPGRSASTGTGAAAAMERSLARVAASGA